MTVVGNFPMPLTVTADGSTAGLTQGSPPLPFGPIGCGGYAELAIDFFIIALSGVTAMRFSIDRQGTDLRWYQIDQSPVITGISVTSSNVAAATNVASMAVGLGATTNSSLGEGIRIRWNATGAYGSAQFFISMWGK